MENAKQLEIAVLDLPSAEREHLALTAWASLESDASFAADSTTDPEGIAIALKRNEEIESGLVKPITQVEFRQRTGGPVR